MSEFLTMLLVVWLPIGIGGTLACLVYDWATEDDHSQGFRTYAKKWLSTVVKNTYGFFVSGARKIRAICMGGSR